MSGRTVRVVVVLNHYYAAKYGSSVYGMTTSNDEAAQWCRDLAAKYNDPLVASQYVALVPVRDGTWWDD